MINDMKIKTIYFCSAAALMSTLGGCNAFLDEPTSKTTALEVTTADQLDALLGNVSNFYTVNNRTAIYSTDDYGLSLDVYAARSNTYSLAGIQYATWDVEGLQTDGREMFWSNEYKKIFMANMVLNNVGSVSGDAAHKAELVAEAHLLRAYSYMELANTFCLPYTEATKGEMGLPLKQSTSFEELSSRNSLEETYALIEKDLEAARALKAPLMKGSRVRSWRGNTAAINAVSARYWLSRNDYAKALEYADKALAEHHELVDYNTEMRYSEKKSTVTFTNEEGEKVVAELFYPYTHDNQTDLSDMIGWKEFYYFRLLNHESWWYSPSPELLDIYKENPADLRYKYHIVEDYSYDRGLINPAYSYPGYIFFYKDRMPEGPTVAEMYLIKAECHARKNEVAPAMNALNTLRKARIEASAYADETAANKEEAIAKILKERRREMPFAARWADIRRYNNNEDPADDVELTRTFYPYTTTAVLAGEPLKEYKLAKDSRRWATPLPLTEMISSQGGIKQNTY